MVKIIHEREKCIQCGYCASACPEHWKMDEDGKATLIDGEKKGDIYEKEVEDAGCCKDAESNCPVHIIHIK